MRRNTATVTITLPASGASGNSLDTGNAAISTWYHGYAVADADATTFTGICSASASAPTGYTYFRYLGSFYNNASDNIALFYWSGNGSDVTIMWDIPINITTTISAGSWSAGATSCAAGMPSTSTYAIFGVSATNTTGSGALAVSTVIRPDGATGATNSSDGVYFYFEDAGTDRPNIGGQLMAMTDSSQEIDYYNAAGVTAMRIDIQGFIINR